MIQPINPNGVSCSSFLLAAYGTDNQFTTEDTLMKWMSVVNHCNEKHGRVVGFATDCDPRYLRSMRLFMGFYADMPNQQIHLRDDAFHAKVPKLIRNIRLAFINKETSYLDRIYYSWKNVFLIRYWYIWLSSKHKSDLDLILSKLPSTQKHQKKKTKQQYFISLPSLFSIEINSHTLVYLGLLVIQNRLPPQCLNVSIFNSQSCESTFRSCRAMSGPFSSIVNFNVHQFLQRVKKLSYLNSIKSRNNSNNTNTDILFPRHHKLSKTIDSKQISPLSSSTASLSLEAIENTILRAYSDVCSLVVDMNIYQQDQVLPLEKMSRLANLQLMKSRIVDYSCPDKYDSDFDSDSDDSNSEGDEEITANDADDED
ncbi:unnamed protein product, partial [Rotaria sp. Silwood2]